MADYSYTANKFKLLGVANRDGALTSFEFRVLYYLADAVDQDSKLARRKHSTIAEHLSASRRSVQLAIEKLKGEYLEVETGRGLGHTNGYSLLFHKCASDCALPEQMRIPAHENAQNSAPKCATSFAHDSSLSFSLVISQERERARARATTLPKDFQLSEENYSWALDRLGTADAVSRSMGRFMDHSRQAVGSAGLSRDWQAKARLWIDSDAAAGSRETLSAVAARLAESGVTFGERPRGLRQGEIELSPTDNEWDAVVSYFARTGRWTKYRQQYGPAPGEPGCRVPEHFLNKYNIAKGAAA